MTINPLSLSLFVDSMSRQGLEFWCKVWSDAMAENIVSRHNKDCTQYWETRESALSYDRAVREDDWCKARQRIAKMDIRKGDRVLDIGAGTGAMAIPLSPLVKEVTAIEPAEHMRWCLEENIKKEGIGNISIVDKRWEDVIVTDDIGGRHDVVIAAYSLGMTDMLSALRKMDDVASRVAYLFWFAESPEWRDESLTMYSLLNSEEYHPKPQSDVLFNILYHLDFAPEVVVSHTESTRVFHNFEEAVSNFSEMYDVSEDGKKEILADYLRRNLVKKDGVLCHTHIIREAMLSWRNRESMQ